jgi:hypothetical protein
MAFLVASLVDARIFARFTFSAKRKSQVSYIKMKGDVADEKAERTEEEHEGEERPVEKEPIKCVRKTIDCSSLDTVLLLTEHKICWFGVAKIVVLK